MTSVDQIEKAILELPPQELRKLSAWIAELDQEHWDDQLAQDVAAGKLDRLADEAIRDFQAGRFRTL